MEENQPITARWNTQDVSVQARAELEKAHPVGEVSAVVCWWGLCHATKWQILTDANFPLLDADGNKVGTWDRIMWGKQEKMRWRSLIGFVFWFFVSSFTLGINSEKVHFRCMASQPPSLEMLVLTTSVAGCPKSFVLHVRNWYWSIWWKESLQIQCSRDLFPITFIPFKLQILGRYKRPRLGFEFKAGESYCQGWKGWKVFEAWNHCDPIFQVLLVSNWSNWFHLWKFDPICLKFTNLMNKNSR